MDEFKDILKERGMEKGTKYRKIKRDKVGLRESKKEEKEVDFDKIQRDIQYMREMVRDKIERMENQLKKPYMAKKK